jgi:hypothetical protein
MCYDTGALRAYLDNELPSHELLAMTSHLGGCERCRAELSELGRQASRAQTMLAPPYAPDPSSALTRLRAALPAESVPHQRRRTMTTVRPTRRWIVAAVAIVLAVASLALAPVRAAADQLLQIFRVQNVVFVPVSRERVDQLEQLNFDGKTLFVSEPKVTNNPAEPHDVATADEASVAVGFTLAQPRNLPMQPTSTSFTVTDRTVGEFQVNVESARQLLQLTGVTDITLPDALGAQPIVAEMAPMAMAKYTGGAYTVELAQGRAPQLTLPDGVNLSDLGRAMLRVLGLSPDQADALASQIDWSSTLLVPVPADLSSVRQVSINGAPGVVVTGGGYSERSAQVYWQRGEQFFVLSIEGAGDMDTLVQTLLQTAESVN